MRVIQANKFFYRNGGSEAVMFAERDYLRREGVEVIDFSMQHPRNVASDYAAYFVGNKDYKARQNIIAKTKTALSMVHSSEAVKKFEALIKDTQPDLVHCHNIYHQLTPSIIPVAQRLGVPVVLTLHDFKPVCPVYTQLNNGKVCTQCRAGDYAAVVKNRCAGNSLFKSTALYAEAKFHQLTRSYHGVTRLIAPSKFMADMLSTQYYRDIPIDVIYNGVPVPENAAGDNDGYFLYLGRLSHEKGIETLLEAHKLLPKARLVVAGGGLLDAQLRDKYPQAKFVGELQGDELTRTIEGARAVVVPSQWHENCPMSVLEAMAQGKPVIASRIGGIPELVTHKETGFLFNPGNVRELALYMNRLNRDECLVQQLGTAGRQRVKQKYSLQVHGQSLQRTYARACGVASRHSTPSFVFNGAKASTMARQKL